MLPLRIGRYDVSAEIGRGSTSIVYRGIDPIDGRIVAIKTLQRDGADGDADPDSILLRFRNEARAIGRLRHPGIVAVDEFGEDGLRSWIAMEHVEGGTLDDLLAHTPLPGRERALALMDELLDALGCVHREGICHRDLKPANILLTAAGRVKLTDFGVARLRDLGLTRVSSLVGTPAFMAPEQFGGGALDHRADLFACGVLLYLLLAGRHPFSGPPAAVMHQILHDEPPALSEASGGVVGGAFDDVVARALAKRPDERFASAEDLRAALRDAALQAATSPLATLVETVVQDADVMFEHMPADERARIERALAHREDAAGAMGAMVFRKAHDAAQLVDAGSLYAPDADQHRAFLGHPPRRDADGTLAASAVAGAPPVPPAACNAAQHLLARRLGPVASVLVKRAADSAGGSLALFVTHLLADLPDPHRAALRAELEALLAPSQAGPGR